MYSTRTALIKQLYTDGHITAEEAAEFTSKKLFKMPIAVQPNISATIMITVTSSDFSTDLCMGTVKTTTNTTLSANAQLNSVSSGASTSCTVALGKHIAIIVLPQFTCMPSISSCVAAVEICDTNRTKTI